MMPRTSMRRLILYGIIIFQIAIILSLVRGIQLSRRSSVRIASMIETKAKLEEERDRLKDEGENVQSPFYLEKVARDELHLSKPGDTVVIVPDNKRVGESYNKQVDELQNKPNWKKWWEVLSGSE